MQTAFAAGYSPLMTRLCLTVILLALAACEGAGRRGPPAVEVTATLDDDYYGWAHAPDVELRVLTTVTVAAAQWGGSERTLEGAVFHVVGRVYEDCGGNVSACDAMASNGDNDVYVSTRLGSGYSYCAELTPLAHEVGHIALGGDHDHRDPRWCDLTFWTDMAEALRPAIPASDTQCLGYLLDYWKAATLGASYCLNR